jgi:OOP family OmpA-OmpF porin
MSSRLYLTAAIAVIAGLSVAQARAADPSTGYAITGSGAPVTAADGECVHSADWSAAASYRKCDPRPVAAQAPAPVQAAPEQAPAPVVVEEEAVVVVEAPRPVPFRLSMDALFDFDRAVLRADAAPVLDELTARLAGSEYRTVHIVGHADRIGPAQYNQRLSERRAAAVGAYLAAHGVDGSTIAVSGVGSAEPVTGSQCKGVRGKGLIACLQPDRFAEVTVNGTQTSAMQ